MQHTYDYISRLVLLLPSLKAVEHVPLRRLGYGYTLWFRPTRSITSSLTPFLCEVLNYVPALTATEVGISAHSALSIVSTATHSTVLYGTLQLTSIAFLVLKSAYSRWSTPLKVRVPWALFALSKSGLLTDAKTIHVTPIFRTILIMRLRTPSIANAPFILTVVYLLYMHQQPWEVHVIVELHR